MVHDLKFKTCLLEVLNRNPQEQGLISILIEYPWEPFTGFTVKQILDMRLLSDRKKINSLAAVM